MENTQIKIVDCMLYTKIIKTFICPLQNMSSDINNNNNNNSKKKRKIPKFTNSLL